ncbi:MAG: alpha-glucan family phosphorylase [Methanomicrobiaceae archaeon]|nr:alpha-glucan family phosphorylase [Methanomicrobiaceae archaeon]
MQSISHYYSHIPERLSGLVDLSYNLWWSWNPDAKALFDELNPQGWMDSEHNPVRMLRQLPAEFLHSALNNRQYMRRYDAVMEEFLRLKQSEGTWFAGRISGPVNRPIAYFSAEYGLLSSLPFFAGGLGFLAGDHIKECSDLGVPMVAVGLLYSNGYLHQRIGEEGWQQNAEERIDFSSVPVRRILDEEGRPLVVELPFIEPRIFVSGWQARVGRVDLLLLDTNIEENDSAIRNITSRLYTGDAQRRLLQEIVLGIGGIRMLARMRVGFSAVHLNEGHPAFALLEWIRILVADGLSFEEAAGLVMRSSVFTTHTPVPAGHDVFPRDLIRRHFSRFSPELGIDGSQFFALGDQPVGGHGGFNMTALALRLSAHNNGVSRMNGNVSREMWSALWQEMAEDRDPIGYITNGIHITTWLNPDLRALIDRYMNPYCPRWLENHDNPSSWRYINRIPDEELWQVHLTLKRKLIDRIREYKRRDWANQQTHPGSVLAGGALLDPTVLTIGFARRFSTYKRAGLIFSDPNRLKSILNNPYKPVQIIFAGKAHPSDDDGKRIIQSIYHRARQPEFGGRIAFVEDYGEEIAKYLVHGVDVWLNNPLPPMEASGTSGMKAALNGVLNLSILDGWWLEGYNGRNGWAFGDGNTGSDRDAADAAAIYDILEQQVVPRYYAVSGDGVPHEWVKMMKESIQSNCPAFSARRMVKEYVARYYSPAMGCEERCACGDVASRACGSVKYAAGEPGYR